MKRFLALAVMAFAQLCASQTAVSPVLQPHATFVDGSGSPCALCKLYSYVAGTSTAFPTYTDSSGGSQNTNPITLDVAGGANVWTAARSSYKFVLIDAGGTTVWTVDNVKGGSFPCATANAIQYANSSASALDCDASVTINSSSHSVLAPHVLASTDIGAGTNGSQGSFIMWNRSPGLGETDYVNYKGEAGGGFRWFNLPDGTNPTGQVPLSSLDPAGNFFATNTVGTSGTATPGAQGAYLMWNTALGTGRTAFVNVKGAGAGGFSWYNVAEGVPPASPIASMDASGNLAINQLTASNVCYSSGTNCPGGVSIPTTSDVLAGNGGGGVSAAGFTASQVCRADGTNCPSFGGIDYYWSQSGCANGTGQPSRCTFNATLPSDMPDSSYYVNCWVNSGLTEPADFVLSQHAGTYPTIAGGSIPYAQVQVMQNGTGGGYTPSVTCHAHHP